jgi:hypothetical protein
MVSENSGNNWMSEQDAMGIKQNLLVFAHHMLSHSSSGCELVSMMKKLIQNV